MISKNLIIRKATIADKKTVALLALELWPDNLLEELELEMVEFLEEDKAIILLAFSQQEAIAFIQCQLRYDYVEGTSTSPVGYLEGIYVKEEWRRKGVASSLLKEAEHWAKEKGCQEFASDCELINQESLKFHLEKGFLEANRIICFTKRIH